MDYAKRKNKIKQSITLLVRRSDQRRSRLLMVRVA